MIDVYTKLIYNKFSFLLQALVCQTCGSLLSPISVAATNKSRDKNSYTIPKCVLCEDSGSVEEVSVPYIFRYLVAELASMNIKVKLSVMQLPKTWTFYICVCK